MAQDNDKDQGLDGLPAAIDVDDPEQARALEGIPLRAQQIGALLACGFTCPDIDTGFTLPPGTARAYRHRYYSTKSIEISGKTRDAIISAFLRSRSMQLVASVTPDVIDKAGLGERIKSAGLLMQTVSRLEGQADAVNIGQRISDALSRLSDVKLPVKQINTSE